MISATNGHDIKYKASQKLNDEVEKWLAKGNEIKKVKSTYENYDEMAQIAFNKNHVKLMSKGGAVNNGRSKADKLLRQATQMPILQEYFDLMQDKNCFNLVVEGTKNIISTSQLKKTMRGQTSILDSIVWRKVANCIYDILKENKLK
ncbi:MAG: hypothetical protein WBO70_06380 [Erysipelotrichaceae bacterium]